MTDLREALTARTQPQEVVPLVADPVAYAVATAELEAAVAALMVSTGKVTDEQRERVTAAEQQLAAVPALLITVRTLPPAEWEALVALHPADAGERAEGKTWHLASFRPAVCAACVVNDGAPLTVAEWNSLVRTQGRLSAGEEDLVFVTAVRLNTRAVTVATGKG